MTTNHELYNQAIRFNNIIQECRTVLYDLRNEHTEWYYQSEIDTLSTFITKVERLNNHVLPIILECSDTSADDACAYVSQADNLLYIIKGLNRNGYLDCHMVNIVFYAFEQCTGAFIDPDHKSYELAFSDGYEKGHSLGHDQGYELGHSKGHDLGFDEGFDKGYDLGFDEGCQSTRDNNN